MMLFHKPGRLLGDRIGSRILQGRVGGGERKGAMDPQDVFVGIDVSKENLEVWILPQEEGKGFSQSEEGWALISQCLQSFSPRLVVLEATGGLERGVVAALAVRGLPVVVVNPRQVRHFAISKGIWPRPIRSMRG